MTGKTIINIGVQQFDKIREQGAFYIDKTGFIKEWWESGSDVTLITRPRRFGKTLNMSMTECFFSNKYAGRADLFEGLAIWSDEKYRQIQGMYPVICLSFAGIKTNSAEGLRKSFKGIITDVYKMYKDIMRSHVFDDDDRRYFKSVNDTMDDETAVIAIKRLGGYMERHYGKKTIVLLDEYDTPMQEAWSRGYWEEAVRFFRGFFDNTFKTNPHLYRGIITGITRISKESIFSDLNNLDVVTTTSDEYADSFGFTQDEVFGALDDMGLGSEKEGVKQWYDGFTFGRHTDIYNPWSITAFIKKSGRYAAYWANTSSNSLINSLIRTGNAEIKQTMEALIKGCSFKAAIDEQIVFNQLDGSANAVWSLLLATGYLKVLDVEVAGERKEELYTLTLTNMETLIMFENMVSGWFGGDTGIVYNEFINAMLCDNVRKMNTFMNKVALNTFSSFDSGNHPAEKTEPERFYHGFVLGMIVNLADGYKVRSNRESGYGRYDVMIQPLDKTKKAFIFEFKVLSADDDESTLEDTVANAHRQIEEKRYEAELISEGFSPEQIRTYGFAFRGKECLIG
ncbi:MAG: ATP-binding protein [Lachnospiraceae bacterium]|nr:ATP-binding protein [Lachnospiraceae bacterium]